MQHVYGNLSIMYPMIISAEEVKKNQEIVAEVKEELKAQEIPYKDYGTGHHDRDSGSSDDQ